MKFLKKHFTKFIMAFTLAFTSLFVAFGCNTYAYTIDNGGNFNWSWDNNSNVVRQYYFNGCSIVARVWSDYGTFDYDELVFCNNIWFDSDKTLLQNLQKIKFTSYGSNFEYYDYIDNRYLVFKDINNNSNLRYTEVNYFGFDDTYYQFLDVRLLNNSYSNIPYSKLVYNFNHFSGFVDKICDKSAISYTHTIDSNFKYQFLYLKEGKSYNDFLKYNANFLMNTLTFDTNGDIDSNYNCYFISSLYNNGVLFLNNDISIYTSIYSGNPYDIINYLSNGTQFLNSEQYQQMQQDYNTLMNNYSQLQSDYNSLNSQYTTLFNNYQSLLGDFSRLQTMYNSLDSRYNQLQSDYDSLEQQYNDLLDNLDDYVTKQQYDELMALYIQLDDNYNDLDENYDNLLEQYNNLKNSIYPFNKSLISITSVLYNSNDITSVYISDYDYTIEFNNNAINFNTRDFDYLPNNLSSQGINNFYMVVDYSQPVTANSLSFKIDLSHIKESSLNISFYMNNSIVTSTGDLDIENSNKFYTEYNTFSFDRLIIDLNISADETQSNHYSSVVSGGTYAEGYSQATIFYESQLSNLSDMIISRDNTIVNLQRSISDLQIAYNNLAQSYDNMLNGNNFANLFFTIAETPFASFKQIWNVDFLGVNLAGFVTGILFLGLIIWVIKKIF